MRIKFRKITGDYPYELLLQADETKEGFDTYLFDSEVFIAEITGRDKPVGVCCLLRADDRTTARLPGALWTNSRR